MMRKTAEGLVIGIVIWIAGALIIILLGQSPYFPLAALPSAFLAAPLMYGVTRFHLRGVPVAERTTTATILGMTVAAVQFPLDALGWFIITNLGYPPLSQVARDAGVLGLLIGYFWLLVMPYWTASAIARSTGKAKVGK
ncbi:MAG: hypothetical protein COS63_04385 [Anaerolineae bacterium CG06_land_8_20_14_3_00_57_67]|nr:MAG: hypothetical protein COS63_04385 [Anaerolineae bacterium CG06_land_8_20_14_3_00_57_67]